MKGDATVIARLNAVLTNELTAIDQYFLHAKMFDHWGFGRLAHDERKASIDEMRHAETLMERILFLEGIPNMKPLELTVGKTVKDMIESDLDLELAAVKMYNEAIRVAIEHKDNGSRDLFQILLDDEEDHVDWLEAQTHQIKELGYERYLTMQMGEFEEKD